MNKDNDKKIPEQVLMDEAIRLLQAACLDDICTFKDVLKALLNSTGAEEAAIIFHPEDELSILPVAESQVGLIEKLEIGPGKLNEIVDTFYLESDYQTIIALKLWGCYLGLLFFKHAFKDDPEVYKLALEPVRLCCSLVLKAINISNIKGAKQVEQIFEKSPSITEYGFLSLPLEKF